MKPNIFPVGIAIVLLLAVPTRAWNGLGHKVVADIAWRKLDAAKRAEIVRILRRHPRFDEDFAKKMPGDVEDEDRWIFQQAASWPDVIRGNRDYDMPSWHFVDFPIFVGPERPVDFNRETLPAGEVKQWNVMQAVQHSLSVLHSDAAPDAKALAYCWLFHLVGDLHQPLHSTALVCDKLPTGDRGGNDIKVVQGRNLHSLWDGLLGRDDRMADVARELAELEQHKEWWIVDASKDVPAWVAESHQLCESFVYCPEIIAAVEHPGVLASIALPEAYLKSAGEKARQRVVAAGLRLSAIVVDVAI